MNHLNTKMYSVKVWGKGFGSGSSSSSSTSPVSSKKSNKSNKELNDLDNKSQSKLKIKSNGKSTFHKHCPTLDESYPGLRCVHSDPPIYEIDNFFTKETCDRMILDADTKGVSVNSKTFSSMTSSHRTSTTWYLSYKDVPELLSNANYLTGFDIQNFEEPQIVRYEMGQQFSWHYDAIPKSLLRDENGNQRLATLLIYLNDVDSGGSTVFKDLSLSIQPKKGKALLFFPSFIDGKPDDRTEHAGQIAFDTKWIAQIWIHESPYTPSLGPDDSNIEDGIKAVETLRINNKN